VWLAVADSAEETRTGSDGRAEWFDQINVTPCQPRDLVADVDMDRGGRPGWPVDRNLYPLNVRANSVEDLEQGLTVVGLLSLPTFRTAAAGADRSGQVASCRRARRSLAP